MIKFDCNIKVKHNFNNIENIVKKLPELAQESVEDIIKNIQGYAIKLEKGHNEQGIKCELVEGKTGNIKGRTYADPNEFMSNGISYLWFEYFGTGKYAEQEHMGKTKHFVESSFTEWFIPVSKVDRALHYPVVEIQGQQFYIAHGSKANHFLSDAEFESRNENKEIVQNKLKEMLEQCCQ